MSHQQAPVQGWGEEEEGGRVDVVGDISVQAQPAEEQPLRGGWEASWPGFCFSVCFPREQQES